MEYRVLSNLKHNDQVYEAGQVIELDEAIAQSLIADGIIASKDAPTEEQTATEEPAPAEAPEAPAQPEQPAETAAPEAPATDTPLDEVPSSAPSAEESPASAEPEVPSTPAPSISEQIEEDMAKEA